MCVDELSELEIAGPDAGLEEEGVGGEVWVGPVMDHKIKGGDCFAEAAHIEVVDQTALVWLKIEAFRRQFLVWL